MNLAVETVSSLVKNIRRSGAASNHAINADGKYFCKILNNSVVLEQFVAAGYHDRVRGLKTVI